MKVFLTGATGYIGHQLAIRLAEQNYKVHALVRNLESEKIPVHPNIVLFKGDINDLDSLRTASAECTYVFHTAAFTDLTCTDIDKFYNANVLGTDNVLKASRENGVQKVIFTSSVSVFGPSPMNTSITETQPRITSYANDYELTKTMAENLVLDYNEKGLPGLILNVSRVYGPGHKSFSNGINRFVSSTLRQRFVFVPAKLEREANYVYIEDVIQAHILAMRNGIGGEKYIIGGENASYEKLFSTIINVSNRNNLLLKINYDLLKVGLFLKSKIDWLVLKKSTITPRILDYLFTNRTVSSNKAQKQLGYQITSLQKGMEQTLVFLKN